MPTTQCRQGHSVLSPGAAKGCKPRLSSPLFKLGTRLVCGLNGSVWAGTSKITHHLRTPFEDAPHGANMQSSSILLNVHQAALEEGYLPSVLHLGADNTPKETKNSTTLTFVVWLLCMLADTSLYECQIHFLLVGHTHNEVVLPANPFIRQRPICSPMSHSSGQRCARTASSPGWLQRWLARITLRCQR